MNLKLIIKETMISEDEYIKCLVDGNAKILTSINNEEEMSKWLSSLLYSVVGFMREKLKEQNKQTEEPIDEEKLEKLAFDCIYGTDPEEIEKLIGLHSEKPKHLTYENIFYYMNQAFKDGYKKAKEL